MLLLMWITAAAYLQIGLRCSPTNALSDIEKLDDDIHLHNNASMGLETIGNDSGNEYLGSDDADNNFQRDSIGICKYGNKKCPTKRTRNKGKGIDTQGNRNRNRRRAKTKIVNGFQNVAQRNMKGSYLRNMTKRKTRTGLSRSTGKHRTGKGYLAMKYYKDKAQYPSRRPSGLNRNKSAKKKPFLFKIHNRFGTMVYVSRRKSKGLKRKGQSATAYYKNKAQYSSRRPPGLNRNKSSKRRQFLARKHKRFGTMAYVSRRKSKGLKRKGQSATAYYKNKAQYSSRRPPGLNRNKSSKRRQFLARKHRRFGTMAYVSRRKSKGLRRKGQSATAYYKNKAQYSSRRSPGLNRNKSSKRRQFLARKQRRFGTMAYVSRRKSKGLKRKGQSATAYYKNKAQYSSRRPPGLNRNKSSKRRQFLARKQRRFRTMAYVSRRKSNGLKRKGQSATAYYKNKAQYSSRRSPGLNRNKSSKRRQFLARKHRRFGTMAYVSRRKSKGLKRKGQSATAYYKNKAQYSSRRPTRLNRNKSSKRRQFLARKHRRFGTMAYVSRRKSKGLRRKGQSATAYYKNKAQYSSRRPPGLNRNRSSKRRQFLARKHRRFGTMTYVSRRKSKGLKRKGQPTTAYYSNIAKNFHQRRYGNQLGELNVLRCKRNIIKSVLMLRYLLCGKVLQEGVPNSNEKKVKNEKRVLQCICKKKIKNIIIKLNRDVLKNLCTKSLWRESKLKAQRQFFVLLRHLGAAVKMARLLNPEHGSLSKCESKYGLPLEFSEEHTVNLLIIYCTHISYILTKFGFDSNLQD